MASLNPFRPRRIRIVEPGWETFSSTFGTVLFEDGLSVDPVSHLEQQRLAGLIRIESAEEAEIGQQLGPAIELTRNRAMMASDDRVQNVDRGIVVGGEMRLAASVFTRSELEEIADSKGLAGLRDIATGLGVKGRSINDMIAAILEAQENPVEPVPAPVATDPAPTEG